MTDNSNSIIDLSSLQGQIANLVLSLEGLNYQQDLDETYLDNEDKTKESKEFIHDLKNLIQFGDDTNPAETSNGMSTYYISTYIYSALLALNKYVNEAKYGKEPEETEVDEKLLRTTNPIRPFAGSFSQDLFCIIKKDGYYEISKTKPTENIVGNYADLTFSKKTPATDVIESQLTTRQDLLNQNKIKSEYKSIFEWKQDVKHSLVPVGLTTSDYNFGANMRKLLTDLYKEYYYYEILDIQKRLNRDHEGASKLDTELRLLLQKARNAFTREIYKPDVDITSEFPMSDIMYELNDYIAEMDNVDKYKGLLLFDNGQFIEGNEEGASDIDNSLKLYQFIEEKTHMMNMVGNAIHYGLELSKRIQRMKEYTDATHEDTITDENPHFEQNTFSEDHCIKGIDEGMAMIRNLIDDLQLLTGDLGPAPDTENPYEKLHLCLDHGLDECLNKCNDIYYNFNVLKTTSDDFKGESKFYDFNNLQLDKLGVLEILKKIYVSHDQILESAISTRSLFKDELVSRYDNPDLYKNYALLIIKIVIMLGILHNFRIIQTYNTFKDVETTSNTRNVRNSRILTALNKPLPKDLSIMEFVKIEELKKQLRKKLSTRDNSNIAQLNLPTSTGTSPDDVAALKGCFVCILEIMNKMSETEIIKGIDSKAIENLFKRFYPFTKSMIYNFDEYFTIENEEDGNKLNLGFTNHTQGYHHILLTNGLNYVAQGIVGSEKEDYTNEDFEKMLTKLIYLCNCITVNWSHMDDAIHKTIELSKTSIYKLFEEDFGDGIASFDDLLKGVSIEIYSIDGETTKFGELKPNDDSGIKELVTEGGSTISGTKTTQLSTKFIKFIHKEMKTMLQSDLPLVVKYVYWVVLYCINSYFIHLYTRDAFEVLTAGETTLKNIKK